jgi:hypothetical protein
LCRVHHLKCVGGAAAAVSLSGGLSIRWPGYRWPRIRRTRLQDASLWVSSSNRNEPGDLHRAREQPVEGTVQLGHGITCTVLIEQLSRDPLLDHDNCSIRRVMNGVQQATRLTMHGGDRRS